MNHAQIRKNKIRRIFLIAFLCCAFGCLLAGAFISGMPFEAHAEAKNLNDESTATLFLPSSYEQYLKLNSPSSVAINDKYIAIADGKIIYIYDKTNPAQHYRTYTYEGGDGVTVGKMQFSQSNNLYFLSSTGLYELPLENELKENQVVSFTPYTFLIDGDTLFTVTAHEGINTAIYSFDGFEDNNWPLDLARASKSNTNISNNETAKHTLITLANDVLYCAIGDTISRYNSSDLKMKGNRFLLDSSSNNLVPISICATNESLYYTTQDGLYRSDLNGQSEAIVSGSSFGALTEWNGHLYFLQDNAVWEYNIAANQITDFEIAANSPSVNRLNTATDCVRAGELLVTADSGNDRISVYDIESKSFETLSCEGISHVATDGTIIAATNDEMIFIFERVLNPNTLVVKFSCTRTIPRSNVEGIVCVYGTVYFVTKDYRYGKIVNNADSENGWSEFSIQRMNDDVPKALAADLYGNLYVAFADTSVRSFSEEQFAEQNENGTVLDVTVPTNATSLRADFQGNLYYLNNGKMYCNGEKTPFAEINGKDFVYTGDTEKTPVSFALGFEDDEVYFLFGDFIVKSNAGALGFPSLGTISAEGIYDEVTRVHKKDEGGVSLLDVKEHSIGIRVALEKLDKDTAFFPYSSYSRTNETERAVQLAQTDGYRLVALYENKTYTVELFREEDLVVYGEEDEDPAFAPSWTGESGTRYFAVDTFVYNYPCLSAARTKVQLPRGTRVQLCDVVLPIQSESVAPASVNGENVGSENGFKFAYVEYTDAEGNAAFGYLPLSFLSTIDPTGVQNETFTLGTLKENVSFQDENGERIDVAAGEEVMLYDNGDGTFTAAVERDGVRYTAQVNDKIVSHGESNALRIALIVILTALAVVIIGAYFYLLPRSKYGKKKN